MAADNKLLGQFDLVGLPPAPRGLPQIEVSFDIDANGIVHVSAKDKATAKEQQIRIQASGGLSDDDIERMVNEAEEHAETDKATREMVETRNQAEGLIHSTEKNLTEYGDQVSDEDKQAIEEAIADLRAVKDGEDASDIQAKTEILSQAAMKLGEAMYKASQEEGGPDLEGMEGMAGMGGDAGPAPEGEAPEDDGQVLDADFEEVDPEKKSD